MFKWVVLLVQVVALAAQNCPNEWALSKVNVRLYPTFAGKAQLKGNVSINIFKSYETMEVINANVTVLCQGMVQDFPVLTQLSLIEANISKIHAGAFQQVPNLRYLSLAINHLKSIDRHQLDNLNNLTVLYLSSNEIEHIEDDTFDDLINLKKIYLDRNKIIEIQSRWFLNKPRISVIDLSFNRLSKIQSTAFTLPQNSRVTIRLQYNIIEEIEARAVIAEYGKEQEEKPHLTLYLGHNHLSTISKRLIANMDKFHSTLVFNNNKIKCFHPETLRVLQNISVNLQVANNPLNCNCFVAATNFVNDNELKAKFSYTTTEQCPLHLI